MYSVQCASCSVVCIGDVQLPAILPTADSSLGLPKLSPGEAAGDESYSNIAKNCQKILKSEKIQKISTPPPKKKKKKNKKKKKKKK